MTRTVHPLALAAAAALLFATAAAAQPAAPRLSNLQIQIWPEYDRPSALVMLTGALPPGTQLPVQVTLPMPVSSPQPSAVAQREIGGGLMNAQWDFDIAGEFAQVHITAEMPEVRLEYYVPMDLSAPERRFRFNWPGGIAVGQVSFEVLQPAGARDLFVFPGGGPSQVAPNGLIFQVGELGALDADDTFVLELGYVKSDARLTAQPPAGAAGQAPPSSTAPQAGPAPPGTTPGSTQPPSGGQVHVAWMWMAIVAMVIAIAALVIALRK